MSSCWHRGLTILYLILILLLAGMAVPGARLSQAADPLSAWDQHVRDSLFSLAADAGLYPPEPSIQDILDGLGYPINAATDTITVDLFCLYPRAVWRLVAEHSGLANTHEAGWYRSGYPRDTHTVILGPYVPGDSVVVTGSSSTRRGLFQRRDSGTAWYTEKPLNYDKKVHHRTFSLPGGVGYIVFWEDLGWVTDGDFNDMVFEVRPENLPPALSIDYARSAVWPPHYICEGDSVCLEIHVSDLGCFGDSVTVEMISGFGTFVPVTGVGDFRLVHCWLPTGEGPHGFVFRATDNLGLSDEEYFDANVWYDHTPPDLPDAVTVQVAACLPGQACVDFPIADTTITQVWITPQGVYDTILQRACFNADTAGTYGLWVIAADTCGNADSTQLTVTVSSKRPPVVTAPADIDAGICGPDTICVRFSVFDPDNDVVSITTDAPGFITPGDSTVCLPVYAPGDYELPVYVVDACGYADTARVRYHIAGGEPLSLICPPSFDTVLCQDGLLCFPISFTGGVGQVLVDVLPDGFYNLDSEEVCFPTSGTKTYNLTLIAHDDCGADTCYVSVAVTINRPPQAILPADYETLLCGLQEVCVPLSCADLDGNLTSCTVVEAPAGYQIKNDQVCFTPPASGTYRVIAQATDLCGATGRDTVSVAVRLNAPPVVTAPSLVTVGLCGPDSVCVSVGITDLDNNLAQVIVGPNARYNSTLGRVCFYAPAGGTYALRIIAVDVCNAADTADVQLTVNINVPPEITCPNPMDTLLCAPGQICFPVAVADGGITVTVKPLGTYNSATKRVCFTADTAGLYRLSVIAADTCGHADTCIAQVRVRLNHLPTISGQSGLQFTLCKPTQVCIPVGCADEDGNLASCALVSGPGTYNGSAICFTPTQSGRVYFTVRAIDQCGANRELQVYADVTLNAPPTITAPSPIVRTICAPEQVCVNFTASDPEGGPLSFSSSHGQINPANRVLCVSFNSDSNLCVNIYATDTCGNADTATVCFTIKLNRKPDLAVAQTFSFDLCAPGQVCFPVTATDREGVKTGTVKPIGSFNATFTQACFTADTAGVYALTLIVMDSCLLSDTATTRVTVKINRPPVLTVPGNQTKFLCATGQQVCVTGISASDPDGNLSSLAKTSGPGVFNPAAGELCFVPDTVGKYCFSFTATDACQATAVGSVCVTLTLNRPPEIDLAPHVGVDIPGAGVVCFPVAADDPDLNQRFNLEKTRGAGAFVTLEGRNHLGGQHCFSADTAGCYPFTFRSTDSCGLADVETTLVCVTITPPDTGYRICIDTVETLNGRNVDVNVLLYESMEMGGLDFLICFDPSVLAFKYAMRGASLNSWEYFTYRKATPAGCVSPCNVTAVHLIGIADMNNGGPHPPEEAFTPKGILATLTFFVTEDRTVIGQCIPVTFCSYDCTDNTVSSRSGDTLYVAYTGVDPDCFQGFKSEPVRAITFCQGIICVVPPPDDRGDINLNGIANEVADAVLFTNYFIYGNSVWDPIYYENQWLASDVNNDGFTRTVADLVYLIRIITGDAEPIGKLSPAGESARLELRRDGDQLVLASISPIPIGGLFVRLTGEVSGIGEPVFSREALALSPKHRHTGEEVRLLFAAISVGAALPAGPVELARFPLVRPGAISVAEADAATYAGAPLMVELSAPAVPERFELLQNYPNPFNAGTVIRFALPTAANFRLTIYDVIGRRIREFEGFSEPGMIDVYWDGTDHDGVTVATGIYFYRAVAADFVASRKMLLVK